MLARMRSGFAVIGDTQHLPGYSLLLAADASTDDLHAHVHPRYEWEPDDFRGGPVWRYAKEVRNDATHAFDVARHGVLKSEVAAELERRMAAAYPAD